MGRRRRNNRQAEEYRNLNDPNTPVTIATSASIDQWNTFWGVDSDNSISPAAALTIGPVWQAVSLICDDLCKLPLHKYAKIEGAGRERVKDKVALAIRRKPNNFTTASVFKQVLTHHAILWGNGYAYIDWQADGGVQLYILPPDRTGVKLTNGELRYWTIINGKKEWFPGWQIFHLRGLGSDGIQGYPLTQYARDSFVHTKNLERFGSQYFKNGSLAKGVLTYPGKLSPEAAIKRGKEFDAVTKSMANAHSTTVLYDGMKYEKLTLPNNEAQFLESREFQKEEVACWLKIPPHKLGIKDAAGFASREVAQQEYLDQTLMPWIVKWQEECWDKLLTEAEKQSDNYYFEFVTEALVSADYMTRMRGYSVQLQWGIKNRNEVRAEMNLPSIGPEGDVFLTPSNMQATDPLLDANDQYLPEVMNTPDASQSRSLPLPQSRNTSPTLSLALRGVLVDALGRLVRRQANIVRKAAKKPGEFLRSIEEFVAEEHATFHDGLKPALDAINAAHPTNLPVSPVSVTRQHLTELQDGLLKLAGDTTAEQLQEKINSWADDLEKNIPNIATKLVQQ